MALTKILVDAELVLKLDTTAVINKTFDIDEDGIVISQSRSTTVILPPDDHSTLHPSLIAVLDVFHNQAAIDAWNAAQITM